MLFNSYIFVFLFFPICLAGYYGLLHLKKAQGAKNFLTAMSFWLYGYFNLSYLLIMVCSIGVNYLFHLILSGGALSARRRRAVLWSAVTVNLGVLFYFKYFDFFIDTCNAVFGTGFALRHILLPLGISFFTFQQISFVVDTYRGEVRRAGLVDYALFVSFFPQLIAGPIVNHGEMMPQFDGMGKRGVAWEQAAQGAALFVLGLAKKVLVADVFGAGADYGYGNLEMLGRMDAALVILFYALQLYFDFSGYCDMARGIGKMLGIEIPVNFNAPYQAVNIIDFWKRWHITLNRFFTGYVYIPLGGNRRGQARMYLNLMLVFVLSGLWHGAGWNYLVWGAMHGVLYVATRFWLRNVKPKVTGTNMTDVSVKNRDIGSRIGHGIMTGVSRVLLFIYVSIAWVYFRAQDIAQANRMLFCAFQGEIRKISMDLAECFQVDEFWYVIKVLRLDNKPYSRYILMWAFLAAGIYLAMIGRNAAERAERIRYGAGSAVVFAVLTVWCVLAFSGVSTFLYFNF